VGSNSEIQGYNLYLILHSHRKFFGGVILEWLEVRKTEKVEVIVEEVDLLEKVRQSGVRDNEVVKAVEKMKQVGIKMLKDKEWRKVNGIMYKEGKVYIVVT